MALIERLQKNTDATHWKGKIPLNYIYTSGRGYEIFLKALKEKGVFIGTRCDCCDIVYFPSRIFCERCLSRIEDNTVELPNQGEIVSFTLCNETYDGKQKEEPSVVAFINIAGSCGGLMHWIREVSLFDIEIGMRVEAVIKPTVEREGSILDILYFKPAHE